MKRVLLLTAVAAWIGLVAARPAAAQASTAPTGPQAGIKAGWLWPREGIDEAFGGTLQFGADLSYRSRVLGIGVDGRYSRKATDVVAIDGEEVIGETKWTSVPLSGNVYLNVFVDQGNTLYVGGGPTYLYTKIEGAVVGADLVARFGDGRWTWGWNGVVGADSGRLYLEGQFLWVKETFDDALPEVDLGGFSLVLGYRF